MARTLRELKNLLSSKSLEGFSLLFYKACVSGHK